MATAHQIRDLIAQTTTGTAQAAQLLRLLA